MPMLANRLYLLWCYGKNQFLVGGAYNLVCLLTLAQSFSWSGFVYAFILKAFVFAVTVFLLSRFRSRNAIFFYINLGLSPRFLKWTVGLIDFLFLALILTLMVLFR